MRGALEAKALDPALVILGQEIRCEGLTELIGIWIEKEIPGGLSPQETAARIRDQGGLVYAPHPFAYIGRGDWHAARSIAVADIVESFNPRAFYRPWNRRAATAAASAGLPSAASSDAHFPWEIGCTHMEVPSFATAGELLEALGTRRIVSGTENVGFCHVLSISLGLTRRLRGQSTG